MVLQTEDWQLYIEREMELVRANTSALFQPFSNSLLGEDFSIPSMSFDMDGMYSMFNHLVMAFPIFYMLHSRPPNNSYLTF